MQTPNRESMTLSKPPGKRSAFLAPQGRWAARRWLVAVIVASGWIGGSWILPGVGLGQDAAKAPLAADSPGDLLRSPPYDRITLTDGSFLLVEPISPRPLPPYDPSKDRKKDSKQGKSGKEGLIQIGDDTPASGAEPTKRAKGTDAASKEKASDDLDPNNAIAVHLMKAQGQAEIRDFKVRRSSIKTIEYFEDLLVAEADRLTREREFARAFECLLFVKARDPRWSSLDDTVNRLLFAEGSAALIENDFDRGVRLLRELLERKRDFPGLLDQLATAYSQRIENALQLGLYLRGRTILHQLEEIAPEHVKYRAAVQQFVETATRKLEASKTAKGSARLDEAAEALRIWPELAGAAAVFEQAFARVPTLDVAVTDLPKPLGPWIRTPADTRVSRLLYRPLLHADDDPSMKGTPPDQLASGVETTDLGRRLVIRLKPGAVWSDGSRPVSSIDVARTLIDRTDPHSSRFLARWADLLERIETPDDKRVEIRFNRIPLRSGAWFTGPIGPAHAADDGRIATASRERSWVTNGPFHALAISEDRMELLASEKLPGDSSAAAEGPGPRIKRIREIRIADGPKAVGALIRGEVSLLERVPVSHVATLKTQPEIKLGKFRQPMLHRIALDGRNPVLRNRSLKRGLSYAIDRKGLLEDRLLKRPADAINTISDGPLPKGSYADADDVKPLEYNPMLAQMLLAAARKETGNAPITLKFEYPDVPDARIVAPLIAEAIRVVGEKSGLKIEAVERRESELEAELRSGRRFDLAYQISACPDAIADLGQTICPALDAPSDADPLGSAASPRIMQLLLELERSSEFPTAKGIATQIDRESRFELPVLPLWQLEQYYAWRTRLTGIPEACDRLYESVETWQIAPWFARDSWVLEKKR